MINRSLCGLAAVVAIAIVSVGRVAAQQDTSLTRKPIAQSDSTMRTDADEEFDLDITERRITADDFHASTEVAIGNENGSGLNLRVGVAIAAQQIELLLRGVKGHVRFRATLDPVLERIRRFRSNQSTR